MFDFLQKVPVHVKIYANAIEVTDLRTGNTIRQAATQKFSSSRMLVADFNAAETLGRSILALLKTGRRPLKIAVQQMIDLGGGTTNTEQRHLRDLCAHLGAAHTVILLHTRKITTAELLKLLELRQEELPVDVTC